MTEWENLAQWRRDEIIRTKGDRIFSALPQLTDGTVVTLVALVSQMIGKPIKIQPVGNERWEQLTGMTLDFGTYFGILIRPTDSIYYQIHCILHELAHLLFEHPPTAAVHQLQGQFGPAMVVHVRLIETADEPLTEDDAATEGEAEYLAHLLARLILRPRYSDGEEVYG